MFFIEVYIHINSIIHVYIYIFIYLIMNLIPTKQTEVLFYAFLTGGKKNLDYVYT